MSVSVYAINKGINRPIEFKGLKAQYIWYLGAGLLLLLVVFAILYIAGVNTFICLALVAGSGTALFMRIHKMSRKFGPHGMMKELAKRSIPPVVKSRSRKLFIELSGKTKNR